jgi:hypothetical protein
MISDDTIRDAAAYVRFKNTRNLEKKVTFAAVNEKMCRL